MGFKRPFDSEEFQESSFKQARQVDFGNKLTQFVDSVPCSNAPKKSDITGDHECTIEKCQQHESFENDNIIAEDIGTSAPLSLVTSSSSDEDVGSGVAPYTSNFHDYFEFDFPRRTYVPFEDVYPSYSHISPRKPVPLGPDHQARIPLWCGQTKKNKLEQLGSLNPNGSSLPSGSDYTICDGNQEKLMGTVIIPMPHTESSEVGRGRTDCNCLDEGSLRCVRQHITEAREQLRKSLGHENFAKLGFWDMGEEVASKWSEEEERVFLAVVYSNPVSMGQNFWKHLSKMFPTRTTKEIVSYYFNVFMLWRRAAQNRSNSLEIDSDDDEFHGINRESNRNSEEDEDSAIESLANQYDLLDKGDDTFGEDDDGDDFDGDNDDDSDGDGDGGMRDDSRDAMGEDSAVDHFSEALDTKSIDLRRFDSGIEHEDINTGSGQEDFTIQDDSCLSFELQTEKVEYCGPIDAGSALQASGVWSDHGKCLPGKVDGFRDEDAVGGEVYSLDPCNSKVWDSHYTNSTTSVDFLPTCNIIEEIFGQGTYEEKTRNSHGIS